MSLPPTLSASEQAALREFIARARERKLLVPGATSARYARGYLLFLREQTLMAQAFDLDRLELSGDAIPIAEQVATGGLSGRMGALTVSQTRRRS